MDNKEQKSKEYEVGGIDGGDVDDDIKEIAVETVEVLLSAAVKEQTVENCSESEARLTHTTTERSSSDSGVSVNVENQSIAKNKIYADLDTDEIIEMEITNCTDSMQSSSPLSSDSIQVSSCIATPTQELLQPKNYKIKKSELPKIYIGNNIDVEASSVTSAVMETEAAVMESGENNTDQIPTWPRHTRRNTRNYRHSTQDDDDEENIDEQENSVAVLGTEEEQMPLLATSSAGTNGAEDPSNIHASTSTEMDTSPAASYNRANRLPSVGSSSLLSDDDLNHIRDHGANNDGDDDDDDDDDDLSDADTEEESEERESTDTDVEHANNVADVMNKPKPQYTWSSTLELMRREHGLSGDGRRSLGSGVSHGFNARLYAARHIVERMKISHCLIKHSGCVNCLNFNRAGDLLCSGSDDTRIVVWNWAQKQPKFVFKSGHTENIFQTKFVNSIGVLDIVSAGRDGQVRRSILPSSGGKPQTSLLYRHNGSVHKLVMSPSNPFEVISAGEDAHIRRKDLRSDESATSICKVESCKKKRKIRLFSISHHPYAPEICVCGCDNFVRVYDKRSISKPVHQMCPDHLVKGSIPQVTCAVYNSTGSEVLASYSDDHIYLFSNNGYKPGEYLHRYRGHYNHQTIKGVNFFGPNSEYIVSGSDCGNIFFWDKNTEAIINFMPGDSMGVVNCLEPHPTIPVLATSGLDSSIKIWTPSSEKYPPDLSKLEACVKRNLRRAVFGDSGVFDDREFHYFVRQFLRPPPRNAAFLGSDDSADRHSTSGSTSSDSDSDDGLDYPQMEGIQCRAQ